jgi:hypothetical protein
MIASEALVMAFDDEASQAEAHGCAVWLRFPFGAAPVGFNPDEDSLPALSANTPFPARPNAVLEPDAVLRPLG